MQLELKAWKLCTTQASCLTHLKNTRFRHVLFYAVMMFFLFINVHSVFWSVSSLPSFLSRTSHFSFPLNKRSAHFSSSLALFHHQICQHAGSFRTRLTRPKRACWNTHTPLLSTNDRALSSPVEKQEESASFTSCTPAGTPPLQTPAAVSSSDLWVGIPISFIYVTDQKYVIIISSGFYVLFHFLCIRILVASMVYLKYCLSKREGMDSPKNQGIVITDVICNLRERKAF